MKKFSILIAIVSCLTFSALLAAQTQRDKDLAVEKTMDAIKLFDKGEVNDAIDLLKDAIELDPGNFYIKYELGLCYEKKKNYTKAIAVFEKIIQWDGALDVFYQQLGNCYDLNGSTEKAFETYNKGLVRFPYSGPLYLELGNTLWNNGKKLDAIKNWEFGIRFKPDFASNYYHMANVLLSPEGGPSVWGLIYGEIFLYYEKNTSLRWQEINAKMYQFYNNKIIKGDTSTTVNISGFEDADTSKLAFEINFNLSMLLPLLVASKDGINLKTISEIRKGFLEFWFKRGFNERFPNAVIDFNKKLLDAGFYDDYNHYIFSYGNLEEFSEYVKENKAQFDKFAKWMDKNQLDINSQNTVYRGMYIGK